MSSHRDILQNQNVMDESEFKEVLIKLEMFPKHLDSEQIHQVFLNMIKHINAKKTIDSLEFIECLKQIGEIVFTKKVEGQSTSKTSQETENSFVFQLFYTHIDAQVKQYLSLIII